MNGRKGKTMNIYPEIKKIATSVAKINRLAEQVSQKMDIEGIEWFTAELVHLNHEQIKRLGECVDNDYYCNQWQGYIEDSFHGYLYFKTNVPGEFVRVHFDI